MCAVRLSQVDGILMTDALQPLTWIGGDLLQMSGIPGAACFANENGRYACVWCEGPPCHAHCDRDKKVWRTALLPFLLACTLGPCTHVSCSNNYIAEFFRTAGVVTSMAPQGIGLDPTLRFVKVQA
jgi:hypothetical protein